MADAETRTERATARKEANSARNDAIRQKYGLGNDSMDSAGDILLEGNKVANV